MARRAIPKPSRTPAKTSKKPGTKIVRPRVTPFPEETHIPSSPDALKKAIAKDRVITQSVAVTHFPAICGIVVNSDTPVYVKDRLGKKYLTIAPFEPSILDAPTIAVNAQLFRDNFSAFSSLIKIGMTFQIKSKRSEVSVCARQFRGYRHPLHEVIERWRDQIIVASVRRDAQDEYNEAEKKILAAIKSAGIASTDEIMEALQELKRGIARMAIKHLPFTEGQLPN